MNGRKNMSGSKYISTITIKLEMLMKIHHNIQFVITKRVKLSGETYLHVGTDGRLNKKNKRDMVRKKINYLPPNFCF